MTTSTSSARYTDLYDYTRTAEQIDYELMGQADRLINRLSHFEATCRERGFQVSSDGLGSALRSYGAHALPIDQQVRRVGEAFQRADGGPLSRPVPSPQRRIDWRRLLGFAAFPPLLVAPLLPHVARWATASASNAWTTLEAGTTLAALAALRVSVSSIPGRVGVSAPHWARFILDLPSRHLKEVTLTGKLTKPVFGIGILIAAGIKTYEQAKYDFKVFKDDNLKKWTAVVYDAALILVGTAAAVGGAALIVTVGLPAIGITLAGVASAVATIGVSVALGWAIDRFVLDPYLRSDWHKEHVDILADNLREFKRDPAAFTKVFGSEIANRLGSNAEEFRRDPIAFTNVFGSEIARLADKGLSPVAAYLMDRADQVLNYLIGDQAEPPPACIAI